MHLFSDERLLCEPRRKAQPKNTTIKTYTCCVTRIMTFYWRPKGDGSPGLGSAETGAEHDHPALAYMSDSALLGHAVRLEHMLQQYKAAVNGSHTHLKAKCPSVKCRGARLHFSGHHAGVSPCKGILDDWWEAQ